jgi:hypothetical protein
MGTVKYIVWYCSWGLQITSFPDGKTASATSLLSDNIGHTLSQFLLGPFSFVFSEKKFFPESATIVTHMHTNKHTFHITN